MRMNEDVKNSTSNRGRPNGASDTVPRKSRKDSVWMMQDGDNSKITRHTFQLMQLPKIDMDDPVQVEERIAYYFEKCVTDDVKPGVAGLCLALGISRQTWQSWGQGTRRSSEYTDIVERSRRTMEAVMEQYMLSGKINPVTGIFLLKNNFGYADKSEVVLTPNNPLGEQKDMEVLKRKYLDNVYEYDEDSSALLPDGLEENN